MKEEKKNNNEAARKETYSVYAKSDRGCKGDLGQS